MRNVDIKFQKEILENCKMWRWKRIEKMKQIEMVSKGNVLRVDKKRSIMTTIQHRKASCIRQILRTNCLLHIIKGKPEKPQFMKEEESS